MAYTKATRDGLVPASKPSRQDVATKKDLEVEGYQVNLDNLDVHNLIGELTTKYNQKNDGGVIRNWFKRKRIEGQDKQLGALLSLVRNVREHSNDLVEYKAHLMSQQQVLHNIIIGKIENSQFAVERQREEHQTFMIQQQVEREKAMEELEKLRLENENLKAENRLVKLRGSLIEKITNELDLKHISPPQAFVLIKALNQASTESDFFLAQEQLDQMRAEADMKTAEARKAGVEADLEEFKLNETRKTPQD